MRLRQIQQLTGPMEQSFDRCAFAAALLVFVGPCVAPLLVGPERDMKDWMYRVWMGGGVFFVLLTIAAFSPRITFLSPRLGGLAAHTGLWTWRETLPFRFPLRAFASLRETRALYSAARFSSLWMPFGW